MQIITTHRSADFDGFASVIASTVLYPDAVPILPKAINPNVKAFLSIHKDLFETQTISDIDLGKVTQLIVVDTSKWSRLEPIGSLKKNENLDIHVWDHH